MNHPSFERLLFEPQGLMLDERRELEEHLQTCSECRALDTNWREADRTLRAAQVLEPTPGFVAQFTERLVKDQRRRHSRHQFYVTSSAALALVVVTLFGAYELIELGLMEADTILKVVISFIRFAGFLELVGGFITLVLEQTIGRVPLPYWLLISTVFSGLFIFWAASIYKFSLQLFPNSKGVGT